MGNPVCVCFRIDESDLPSKTIAEVILPKKQEKPDPSKEEIRGGETDLDKLILPFIKKTWEDLDLELTYGAYQNVQNILTESSSETDCLLRLENPFPLGDKRSYVSSFMNLGEAGDLTVYLRRGDQILQFNLPPREVKTFVLLSHETITIFSSYKEQTCHFVAVELASALEYRKTREADDVFIKESFEFSPVVKSPLKSSVIFSPLVDEDGFEYKFVEATWSPLMPNKELIWEAPLTSKGSAFAINNAWAFKKSLGYTLSFVESGELFSTGEILPGSTSRFLLLQDLRMVITFDAADEAGCSYCVLEEEK